MLFFRVWIVVIASAVIKYCIIEQIDATLHNLQIIYNTSAELSDTFDEKLPITTKSEEVEKFLVEHEHIVNVC